MSLPSITCIYYVGAYPCGREREHIIHKPDSADYQHSFISSDVVKIGDDGSYAEWPSHPMPVELAQCMREIEKIIGSEAGSKGYGGDNLEKDQVLDFVAKHCPGHAEGEIIYKVLRWRSKRDPKDLLKIMAWAFLLWKGTRKC